MTSGRHKWHGISMLFPATFKSATQFTVPAVIGTTAPVYCSETAMHASAWFNTHLYFAII